MNEFRRIKGIGDIFGHSGRCVTVSTNSKAAIPGPFKAINNNHGRLDPHISRTDSVLPYHPFQFNQERNQENDYVILLFFDGMPLVKSESKRSLSWSRNRYFRPESEPLKICRLRGPDSSININNCYVTKL